MTVDPKVALIITKLIVFAGMTVLEAIEETHSRTGLPKSIIKKMIE